jgi:hypothetical protein
MKKIIILALVALGSLVSYAQKEPYMVKTFNAAAIKSLKIKTFGGGVTVEGSIEAKTVVEIYIKGNSGSGNLSKSEIEERLQDYTLYINKEGESLVCFAKSNKSNRRKGLSVTFKIKSPKNVDTDLLTNGGGIKLANLHGNLDFRTSGGGLELSNLNGDIHGHTSGGGITARNIEDFVDLSTSGGGINVSYAQGEIKLRTSGGSIRLEKIAASLKANTSGGGIEADILEVGEYLVLHTSAGSIDVNLPIDKGMDVNIRGSRVTMAYKIFDGRFEKNHVQGTINGGGAKADISTNSGNVNIN